MPLFLLHIKLFNNSWQELPFTYSLKQLAIKHFHATTKICKTQSTCATHIQDDENIIECVLKPKNKLQMACFAKINTTQ